MQMKRDVILQVLQACRDRKEIYIYIYIEVGMVLAGDTKIRQENNGV